ncbi:unnamed protein product [Polarella glacialis]|uniref:RING-type domain-containing protein n=1 Tax=Polarella glacialis TaxID=89957 RepID=A0A813L313_POLGL|nr:unnamed protein product [Polarella glacialis]
MNLALKSLVDIKCRQSVCFSIMAALLDCPVCLQTLCDPQLLTTCGHTFCRACIDSLPHNSCPICRLRFSSRDGFRPNYALRMVLEDSGFGVDNAAEAGTEFRSSADSSAPAAERQPCLIRSGNSEEVGLQGQVTDRVKALSDLGVPWGLARLIKEEDAQIALRIFLLDNSGSTAAGDGRILIDGSMVSCTRWEETRHMAVRQARWNAHVGTPCEFVLLNPPSPRSSGSALRNGVDYLRIDPVADEGLEQQCLSLEQMLEKTQPRGPTPLAQRINEIYRRIEGEKEQLAQAAQRVVLIIATDGLPTSPTGGGSNRREKKEFVEALRRMAGTLLVHIVIRLTTGEDEVVEFYNQLDEELEFPLEVLDDIESEAREVRNKGNGWLAYSPLIHTIREQGTFVKLFDLLDERQLTAMEAMVLARLLLQEGEGVGDALLPRRPEDFCVWVAERLPGTGLVYSALARRNVPPINMYALHASLVPWQKRLRACCTRRCNGPHGWWNRLVSAAFGACRARNLHKQC